jgi:carotenoid cleavage dioxygenase-like enzyme
MTTPYLLDEHAPVPREREDLDLRIVGELPAGLAGTFVRNSANPFFPPPERYHWFDGDGMVHGVHLGGDGRASYRNRWIQTKGFALEQAEGRPRWRGINERPDPESPGSPVKDTANTHLIVWNRQLVATWWLTGRAMALSCPGLETRGPATAGATPLPRLAAHPKVDPRTNELVFMGYDPFRAPYLTYGVASPDGAVHHVPIDIPHGHIPHDLAITERFSVLLDLPLGWSADGGRRRITFFRDRPARFGVLPRHGTSDQVQWFEHDPCYLYHLIGSWEEGDTIVLMGCRIRDPIPETPTAAPVTRLDTIELVPHLYRWRLDLRTGSVTGEQLDDAPTEFPRVDDRTWGRPVRHAFHPRLAPREALSFDGVLRYDLVTGGRTGRDWPAGWYSGEVVFAPRPGGAEDDDGWLLTVLSSAREDASQLVVLDARTLERCAAVHLPWRVPLGFHADWVPAGAVT